METYTIKPNGVIEEVTPENGTDFSLEEAQKLVGGYVEAVRLSHGRVMLINEEGKLLGLPVNQFATVIFHMARGNNGDVIVGDVLMCRNNQFK